MAKTPYEALDRMNLVQVRAVWDALISIPWGSGDMYNEQAGISWDDWATEVKGRLERLEKTPAVLVLTHDIGADVPEEGDDNHWRVIDFNNRHRNSEDFDAYFVDNGDGTVIAKDILLRKRLDVGLAFLLSYSSHGVPCHWDINTGDKPDGIIVWTYGPSAIVAKTWDDRKKDAEVHLEMYNNWCNGYVYEFVIQNGEGGNLDQGAGFYGEKDMLDFLKSQNPELWESYNPFASWREPLPGEDYKRIKPGIKVTGDARHVLDS